MQDVPAPLEKSPAFAGRVARDLLHPCLVRVRRDPGEAHAPRLQMNKEQNIIGDQSTPREDLDSEEVCSCHHRHVRPNELPPCRALAAPRSQRDTKLLQNVTDGLIGNREPEIGERAHNPVVTPARNSAAPF